MKLQVANLAEEKVGCLNLGAQILAVLDSQVPRCIFCSHRPPASPADWIGRQRSDILIFCPVAIGFNPLPFPPPSPLSLFIASTVLFFSPALVLSSLPSPLRLVRPLSLQHPSLSLILPSSSARRGPQRPLFSRSLSLPRGALDPKIATACGNWSPPCWAP